MPSLGWGERRAKGRRSELDVLARQTWTAHATCIRRLPLSALSRCRTMVSPPGASALSYRPFAVTRAPGQQRTAFPPPLRVVAFYEHARMPVGEVRDRQPLRTRVFNAAHALAAAPRNALHQRARN